jgi:hypothetical protein
MKPLEDQASLLGCLSQGLNSTLVLVASSIEDHQAYSLFEGALGKKGTHNFRPLSFGFSICLLSALRLEGGSTGQGMPYRVVDYLGVDLIETTKDT